MSDRTTIVAFGKSFAVIKHLEGNFYLIAHPNGPAITNGDFLSVIDPYRDDAADLLRLKWLAIEAFREWAWPQLVQQFFPSNQTCAG